MLINKIETGLWFLKRPDYWAHGAALAWRKFEKNRDTPEDNHGARAWAAERAVPVADALAALGLYEPANGAFPAISRALFEAGEVRAAKSAVAMGGPGDLDLIYAATQLSGARTAVETGVAYGWSSLAILGGFAEPEQSRLFSVDMPYPKAGNEPWVGIVVGDELRTRWTLIRKPDRRGLDEAIAKAGGTIDLAHYDSDKSYQGRMYGFTRMWSALRPGGVFISDDIQDNFGFRDFIVAQGAEFSVTSAQSKFVGIARKL